MSTEAAHESHDEHHDDHHDEPKGIARWLFTTNHKDIGTLYLLFSLLMFFVGGAMALVIRGELFQPGLQLVEPDFFNQMTTMHGAGHGFWCHHAGLCRPGQLAGTDDDRCAGHGIAANE